MFCNLSDKRSVRIKFKYIFFKRSTIAESLNTVCKISVIIKVVGLSVDLMESHITRVSGNIICIAVIETCAYIVCIPCSSGHALFIKFIGYSIKLALSGNSLLI